jgi:hypothetical protein
MTTTFIAILATARGHRCRRPAAAGAECWIGPERAIARAVDTASDVGVTGAAIPKVGSLPVALPAGACPSDWADNGHYCVEVRPPR